MISNYFVSMMITLYSSAIWVCIYLYVSYIIFLRSSINSSSSTSSIEGSLFFLTLIGSDSIDSVSLLSDSKAVLESDGATSMFSSSSNSALRCLSGCGDCLLRPLLAFRNSFVFVLLEEQLRFCRPCDATSSRVLPFFYDQISYNLPS